MIKPENTSAAPRRKDWFMFYRTVIFDLDGTLLDTLGDLAAAGNHALTAMGLPTHEVNAYRFFVGNGVPKLIERILPEINRGEASQELALSLFRRYYAEHAMEHTHPYDGIVPLLQTLKESGVQLGVLSNKDDAFTQSIISHFFPQVMDAVLGRKEGAAPKPDPTSLQSMMAALGCSPQETLYVGDSNVDVLTAHNAGVECCGAVWGFRGQQELTSAGADALAFVPDDILSVVQTGCAANSLEHTMQ